MISIKKKKRKKKGSHKHYLHLLEIHLYPLSGHYKAEKFLLGYFKSEFKRGLTSYRIFLMNFLTSNLKAIHLSVW